MAFTKGVRVPFKTQLMPTVSLLGATATPATVAPLRLGRKRQTFPSASVTVAVGFALTAVMVTA
ncbi:MAG: hypothetical protein B7Y82_13165 [Sphingomonadales bacterium 32-65-25]|nr:MAG: hypothetical protein B7Y82_13165 [Sphingomonadales bacterium 32-65-25]